MLHNMCCIFSTHISLMGDHLSFLHLTFHFVFQAKPHLEKLFFVILKGENFEDKTAPTITLCHSVPVEVNGDSRRNTTSVTWLEPRASDEEGTRLTTLSDWSPGDLFSVGNTTVTYVFTDVSGNQAECSFEVIVRGKHVLGNIVF